MSTNDLVSIFLSIELQSYGLYLLSTIYRNSELSTTGGLIYFLLGAKWFRTSHLCLQLLNSGETLNLMIPSSYRNITSGWTNYSCKVISHKMIEIEVGYRGSKSLMSNFIVKEQRVDGSWCGFSSTHLRCTLMGFEKNYQVRILSYEKINLQRFFSSSVQQSFEEKQNLYPINPWFL